jgi:hypothetical protein
MAHLGHADSEVTLRIYAHVMSHDEGERDALRALVNGETFPTGAGIVEPIGTSAAVALAQEGG